MTSEEIHKRILLFELREILFDTRRHGTQVPEWKDTLEKQTDITPYLVLADWLDEEGDELGELCRIQCELIAHSKFEWIYDWRGANNHPFFYDHDGAILFNNGAVVELLKRRLEIINELYQARIAFVSKKEQLMCGSEVAFGKFVKEKLKEAGFEEGRPTESGFTVEQQARYWRQGQPMGRTTRMLTNVIRDCIGEDYLAIQVCNERFVKTAERFKEVASELFTKEEREQSFNHELTPIEFIHHDNMIAFKLFKTCILFCPVYLENVWPFGGAESKADVTHMDHTFPVDMPRGQIDPLGGRLAWDEGQQAWNFRNDWGS